MSKCKYCHKGYSHKLLSESRVFNTNTLFSGSVFIPLNSRYLVFHIHGDSIFVGEIETKRKIRYCPMCGRDLKETINE